MSFEMQTVKIGEIGRVVTGKTPSSSSPEHFGNDVPFVTPTDFGTYLKDVFSSNRFLSNKGIQAIGNRVLPKNSILVSCIGSDMGKVVMNKVPCVSNQQINSIIPNTQIIDPDFLYYKIVSLYELLRNMATGGSTMPIVNKSDFENIEIELPPLATQRRIAALLTALDDKIELNRRMNETLEGIAGAVWGEWFERYARGEELPEGWRGGTIGDLVFHSKESINPGKQPDTEFLHYSLPAFDNNQAPEKTLGQEILSNKYRVKKYSVLVSKLNPRIPRIWAIGDVKEETAICSTEFQVFVPKKDTYYSFVNLIFQQKEVLESMQTRASGTSSSHQRINPGDILSIEILIPTDDEIERFDKTVRDYFEMRFLSLHQSRTLTALRDALLPRLMSGALEL